LNNFPPEGFTGTKDALKDPLCFCLINKSIVLFEYSLSLKWKWYLFKFEDSLSARYR